MKEFYSPQLSGGGKLEKALPMMADPNYWAQEKLDGCRYLIHIDLDGQPRVYSRRTSDVTGLPVLKTDRIPHLTKKATELLPPGTVIDGEIITVDPAVPREGRSSFVTSIMGSGPEEALRKQADYPLQFAVFDMLVYGGQELLRQPLDNRYMAMHQVIPQTSEHEIWLLPFVIGDAARKHAFLQEIWGRGDEGIILKDHRSAYREGSRNKVWTKVKDELTFDCIITGFEAGREMTEKVTGIVSYAKYKDKVGKVIFSQYNAAGELTEIGKASGFTDEIREDMTQNPGKYLNQVITVRAHQQLESGALRHPRTDGRIRLDKDPQSCVILGDLGG